MKVRLDQKLVQLGLIPTRSQAESYIKLGKVKVGGQVVTKPGHPVNEQDQIELMAKEQYVSRAALKLASVAKSLNLDFKNKVILDVGSSTGGFTDFALRSGARKVIAVELGTDQMHPSLRNDPRIELHEQTNILDVKMLSEVPDLVVIDVSFVSLRNILPTVNTIVSKPSVQIVAMVKPQFEAAQSSQKHKGVIKNDKVRRKILKDFETWAHNLFVIIAKADSEVAGSKGNLERFYLLKPPNK
jgi:23S rRNA (cytidine1920-2'-O)/16S rRNA (cytidine1409-2'-O)-methyltransferase